MGSLILLVSTVMLVTFFYGLKKNLGTWAILLLQVVTVSTTFYTRSKYLQGLALDRLNPTESRRKTLQRELERAYISYDPTYLLDFIVDYDQTSRKVYAFSHNGTRRLNDEDLLRRADLITLLCKYGDAFVCAGFVTGKMDFHALGDALNQISDEQVLEWNRLTVLALKRELAGSKFPAVSQADFSHAFYEILASIPLKDRELISSCIEDLHQKRTVETRVTARASDLLHQAIVKAGAPNGTDYLRYAAGQAAAGKIPSALNLSSGHLPLAGLPEAGVRPLTASEEKVVRDFAKSQAAGETVFSTQSTSISVQNTLFQKK